MVTKSKITLEQQNAVINFLKHLFSEDTDAFWSTISKIDQARIYGMYKTDIKQNHLNDFQFYNYVKDFVHPECALTYERLKYNPGKSTNVIRNETGEVQIRMYENVKVPHIGAMPLEPVYLILIADIELVNGEVNAAWKVRIYRDNFHKTLGRELAP